MRAKFQHLGGDQQWLTVQRHPRPWGVMTPLVRAAKRVLRETAGWLMLLGGLAAIPLPGPGLLITFAGLLLLSRQYAWAERRVDWVRSRALEGAADSVATWPRPTMSIGGAVLILMVGIMWIASPPAPVWWPLEEAWWLPGGVVVGMTQLASAVIGLALLGYSYWWFRGAPEALTAVADDFGRVGQPARAAGSAAYGAVVHPSKHGRRTWSAMCIPLHHGRLKPAVER